MKKMVFLPAWYQDAMLKKHKILFRKTALILGFINVFLIIYFVRNTNTINTLENKRSELSALEDEKIKAKSENRSSELTTLNYFIKDFQEVDFENIKVENKKVSFDTSIGDKNSYSRVIKLIEDKKRFKLLSASKIDVGNNGLKLKISLEVTL